MKDTEILDNIDETPDNFRRLKKFEKDISMKYGA